jgi:hypothetical protein
MEQTIERSGTRARGAKTEPNSRDNSLLGASTRDYPECDQKALMESGEINGEASGEQAALLGGRSKGGPAPLRGAYV